MKYYYEKYQHYIDARGEVLPTKTETTTAVATSKGSFRNREDLQYTKIVDSILLSLFMRTNGKCNDSHVQTFWTGAYQIITGVL